ncbi:MAG: TIGR04255 family protein, partial [Rhizobiaceae bacterium]|nr:TIGR04255 family protein [Rhizobiaceae bacterium]
DFFNSLLDREPLVDAVFEVRMGGAPQLADLLPGALFGLLTPKPTLHRLPAAEIPQPIRDRDPNLAYSPVIRLDWGKFTISVGDRNLVIACKLPYPRWPAFKEAILGIVARVAQVGIAGPVERYSVKYVNLIQAPTLADQIAKINLAVRVGDVEATDDHLSVQVHRNEGGTLHIMSVVTGAQGKMPDGKTVFGVVVDIDSIRTAHFSDFGAFAVKLEPAVESLRQVNKVKFFSCLTEATIDEMGPKYD